MFHTLNRRLGLWRRLETDDGIGGKNSDWVQVGKIRCRIFLPASTEGPRAQADTATHSHFAHFAPKAWRTMWWIITSWIESAFAVAERFLTTSTLMLVIQPGSAGACSPFAGSCM